MKRMTSTPSAAPKTAKAARVGKRVPANSPVLIADTNLSYAWGKAFLEITKRGVKEIASLVVTIDVSGGHVEDPQLREVLDAHMLRHKGFTTETVASTIFPKSMWNRNLSRQALYARYLRALPRLKKAKKNNQYGLYFERLIAYGSRRINQLEHIITTYRRGNRRPTAFQAPIFDPVSDHTHQVRRGFPCLQQVSLALQPGGGLAISGYYASQYIFERAYGNYLGLYNLGQFIAHELDLRLTRVTCIANVARLGDVRKGDIGALIDYVKATVPSADAGPVA